MLSEPKIIERPPQPYLAIRETVTMPFGQVVDRVYPEFFAWLARHGVAPADAPIIKYNLIDMDGELELEFGAPVASAVEGDGRVISGVLPGGRFGSITWQGGYDKLIDANGALIDWSRREGIRWDMEETPKGDRFGCRLEIYRTDPGQEPDSSKWLTDVVIRIAD